MLRHEPMRVDPLLALLFAIVFSLAVHSIVFLSMYGLGSTTAVAVAPRLVAFDVEEAPGEEVPGEVAGARIGQQAEPVPGGARSPQNVDAEHAGGGGDATGSQDFILLVSRPDTITLQDTVMNAVGTSQFQRIDTSRERATRDRRRATPNPADTAFLASGHGVHRERRPVAASDARAGALVAPTASTEGSEAAERAGARVSSDAIGDRGVVATGEGDPRGDRNPRAEGGPYSSPGVGILRGTGERASQAANVAHGRPVVDEGPAATDAETVDPAIRDRTNAEQLASRLVQSLVDSSERTARERGDGAGGVGGPGAPGSGSARAEGGRAAAYGPGSGEYSALDTSDSRYLRWYRSVRRSVYDHLTFPRERMLAMDQGWSVHRVRVHRSGAIAGPVQLQHSSGFADLDEAARRAIENAAPFPPLPDGLSPGADVHTVRLTIEHSNPMVR
jgi:TonB family protein